LLKKFTLKGLNGSDDIIMVCEDHEEIQRDGLKDCFEEDKANNNIEGSEGLDGEHFWQAVKNISLGEILSSRFQDRGTKVFVWKGATIKTLNDGNVKLDRKCDIEE
jgi:hypothetical protein